MTDLLGVGSLPSGAADKSGERPLLIPDFVKTVRWGHRDEDESVLSSDSRAGSHLVIRTKKKLNLEQVTLSQWIGASARILLHLISNGKVTSLAQAQDYVEYMAQIGNLCQTYSTPSVMTMDDAHRRQANTKMLPIDLHTMFFHLEKCNNPPNRNRGAVDPKNGAKSDKNQEICIKFNQPGGCNFSPCKYNHVCLTPGCKGDHPQFKHESVPGGVGT